MGKFIEVRMAAIVCLSRMKAIMAIGESHLGQASGFLKKVFLMRAAQDFPDDGDDIAGRTCG